jgi:hypothetical protein
MPPNYIYIYIVYIQYGSKINLSHTQNLFKFKKKLKKKNNPLRWLGWNDSQNMRKTSSISTLATSTHGLPKK